MSAVRHSTAKCVWECHNSQMPDFMLPLTLTAYHVSNKHKVSAVQTDLERPLSSPLLTYCCSQFYSATCPDWFCSISCAEILVAVIKSEIRAADFGGATLYYKFDEVRVNRRVHHKTAMVCQNSCRLLQAFRCEQSNVALQWAWCLAQPTLYLWSAKNRETNRGTWHGN